MTINLFDDEAWGSLRPLTFTRPVASLRIGILTIAEKWGMYLKADFGFCTQTYLSTKYAAKPSEWFVNGSICPNVAVSAAVGLLNDGEILMAAAKVVAYRTKEGLSAGQAIAQLKPVGFTGSFTKINRPEDIFIYNAAEIEADFALLTKGRDSAKLSSTNRFLGHQIFAEEGVYAECVNFNALNGPIYLGKDTSVGEGANIRGSFALGNGATVKMGAKIYPGTTIGPGATVGGEVKNVVVWGNSQKGHDGYLGNAVMGEWCNLGADTNSSNMKNNYGTVKLFDYQTQKMRSTGLQFCGCIIADHVKTGINTMLNTGTVVGVGCNLYGAGLPPVYVPDFSWGSADGFKTYQLEKLLETAAIMAEKKSVLFTEADKKILNHIFEATKK